MGFDEDQIIYVFVVILQALVTIVGFFRLVHNKKRHVILVNRVLRLYLFFIIYR